MLNISGQVHLNSEGLSVWIRDIIFLCVRRKLVFSFFWHLGSATWQWPVGIFARALKELIFSASQNHHPGTLRRLGKLSVHHLRKASVVILVLPRGPKFLPVFLRNAPVGLARWNSAQRDFLEKQRNVGVAPVAAQNLSAAAVTA